MPPQPTRLPFSLHSCSSEDPEYPAGGIVHRGADAKGWHTARHCAYPQNIVLQLQQPSVINQIQLLSHECQIPTRVELHIGVFGPSASGFEDCSWRRLGAISFADNEQSHYCARELKSIGQLDEDAALLKIVILGAHQNPLNKYRQAALVALNLVGRPQSSGAFPSRTSTPPNNALTRSSTSNLGPMMLPPVADTSDLDGKTAAEVLDLETKKRQAVVREDYDEAKQLKNKVERLRSFGQRIAELENRKKQAVDTEDYDTAKAVKQDIDRLRAQAAAPIDSDRSGGQSARRKPPPSSPPTQNGSFDERPVGRSTSTAAAEAPLADGRPEPPASPGEPRRPMGNVPGRIPKAQVYDDRPAVARGSYGFEEEAEAAADDAEPPPDAEPVPEGFPQGLPTPEPLSASAAKDASDMIATFGDYTARSFHSKTWQLREAALHRMQQSITPQGCSAEAWRILTKAVVKSMKDKVSNVLAAAIAVAGAMCDCAPLMDARDAALMANELTPPLVEKMGDTNPRTQSAAHDAVVRMAQVKQLNMSNQMPLVLKPQKNQSAWRPVLGRLKLLAAVIPLLGIAKAGGDGVPGDALMKFVGAAFSSPNADVRATALSVALQAYERAGMGILKALPADTNPKMREQLMGTISDGGSSPEQHRRASASGATPARKQSQPQQRHTADAAVPSPAPSAEPAVGEDDLKHYEAELEARERALGPDHPDVAEGLSNLAIMYNQQGDYVRAQPLYERALVIWEKTHGPDHPDVAHTLTDLAVLHLEQGREEQGRPLLERALKIQEAALGPDHPDVLAIRDVLLSDD